MSRFSVIEDTQKLLEVINQAILDKKGENVVNMDLQAIQDIIAAFGTVMNLANDFFKLPKVTEEEDKTNEPKEGDEKPKN